MNYVPSDPEGELACQLWEDLVMVEQMENSITTGSPQLVSCPHHNSSQSANLLCDLFCRLEAHRDSRCCPAKYLGDPEEESLCSLWAELEDLGGVLTSSTPAPLLPVDCLHVDNPTSSDDLCELWCAVREHRGERCLECPDNYLVDLESTQLCDLWNQAELLEHAQDTGIVAPPNGVTNVTCPHSDHATSPQLLCEAWCRLEALQGSNCVSCPEEFTSDPAADLLCPLWEELVDLGGPVTSSNGDPLKPVECQHKNQVLFLQIFYLSYKVFVAYFLQFFAFV